MQNVDSIFLCIDFFNGIHESITWCQDILGSIEMIKEK